MYLSRVLGWALRVVASAALALDAYVHADLASRYALNQSGGLSQGQLFQIQAGVAAFAALLILLFANRLVWAFVFIVSASALAAVMISTNYDIGAIGPIPDMYEPIWYGEKALTAVAEAVAAGVAVVGFVAAPWLHRRTRAPRLTGAGQTRLRQPAVARRTPR
jgi:hypothetical protein